METGGTEGGTKGTKGTGGHRGTHCEGETGSREKKKQRPSSEMLKRKRTKGSGSQAPIPEGKPKREAPVERLWERSRKERKETNSKAEYRNPEGRHEKSGRREGGNRGSESGIGHRKKPL